MKVSTAWCARRTIGNAPSPSTPPSARWRIALGDLYFRKIRFPESERRYKEAIALGTR